jgi:hypothetical protein
MKPLFILLALALTACTFHQTVVNENATNLPIDKIVVGQTKWLDVLETLGPPTMLSAQENATSNISKYHMRYATSQTKKIEFLLGYYVVLPFSWADTQATDAIYIEFDNDGVVSYIAREWSEALWRPFSSPENRETTFKVLGGGSAQ